MYQVNCIAAAKTSVPIVMLYSFGWKKFYSHQYKHDYCSECSVQHEPRLCLTAGACLTSHLHHKFWVIQNSPDLNVLTVSYKIIYRGESIKLYTSSHFHRRSKKRIHVPIIMTCSFGWCKYYIYLVALSKEIDEDPRTFEETDKDPRIELNRSNYLTFQIVTSQLHPRFIKSNDISSSR